MKGYIVTIYRGDIALEVFVNKDLSKRPLPDNQGVFATIEITDGCNDKTPVFWDNLDYFINGLNKEQKKDCEVDLKKKNQYYEDWYKDLMWCIKRAKKLNIV